MQAEASLPPVVGHELARTIPTQPRRSTRPAAAGPLSRLPMLVVLVASIVVLAGLGAAAWHWRGPIMRAWPPAARVYALVGGR